MEKITFLNSQISRGSRFLTISLALCIVLFIFALISDGVAQDGAYVVEHDQYIYAGNDRIELVFQRNTGRLYSVIDKQAGVDFISEISTGFHWWAFYYRMGDSESYVGAWQAGRFDYSIEQKDDGIVLWFYWDGFDQGFEATVSIEINNTSNLTHWRIAIANSGDGFIRNLAFPTIYDVGQISSDPDDDYVVYPASLGLLFQNPIHTFKYGYASKYPSNDANMQFQAYYSLEQHTGLYLATEDSQGYMKVHGVGLVSDQPQNRMTFEIGHDPVYIEGSNLELPYPVVVGVFSGDWYDAAQIYRTWAIEQPWVSKGSVAEREDIPQWYKNVGLHEIGDTGTPVGRKFSFVPELSQDRAEYMEFPMLIMWDGWETPCWYINYPEPFPPLEGWDSFQNAIRETHEIGNYVMVYPNVAAYSSRLPSWQQVQSYAVIDEAGNFSEPHHFEICGLSTNFYPMCPGTSFWKDKLTEFLLPLVSSGVDAMQLDAFPIAPRLCVNQNHQHIPGGGNWWCAAYSDIFESIKAEARKINPEFVYSAEGMAEPYLSFIDSFTNKCNTASALSTSQYNDVSRIQIIPLWHTVYHDYSLMVSGISFFNDHNICRDHYVRGLGLALIWGEVAMLHYNGRKMAELEESDDQERAEHLRLIVEARCSYAKSFLVYGRMLRQPDIDVPMFLNPGCKTVPYGGGEYLPYQYPSVLSSLWKAPNGDVGYIFTNVSHDPVTFTLEIDSQQTELDPNSSYAIYEFRNGVYSAINLDTTLPANVGIYTEPLDVLMVGITKPDMVLPVASFAISPENPAPGEEVTLDASTSYGLNDDLVSYEWVFGDGGSTASGEVVSHSYPDTGDYTVTLTVTDRGEHTHAISKTVSVKFNADANGDGVVDIIDIVFIAIHFGEKMEAPIDPSPDVNGDGVVNITDLLLVGLHFATGS